MNLPNKLTLFRIILIVPFVIVMLSGTVGELLGDATWWVAFGIFVIASLTDMLDGRIARKYNLITTFGKFMDPLADKLLVCSAMICLIELERIPAWVVILIIAREFIISGFRLVAADKGVVIAAGIWGKMKTVTQMVMVCIMIVEYSIPGLEKILPVIADVIMWIAVVLTIVSLVEYLVRNRGVLKDEK